METLLPPETTWDCAARQEVTSYSPPLNRLTDMCKNINLPQTSLAGGNKLRHKEKPTSVLVQIIIPGGKGGFDVVINDVTLPYDILSLNHAGCSLISHNVHNVVRLSLLSQCCFRVNSHLRFFRCELLH